MLFVFSNTAADTARPYDSYGHRRWWTAAASCPYYSCPHRAKLVRLVLPRVLFSYSCKNSFDLTAESFWYQLKSLTIPEAMRHPTRETQEHRHQVRTAAYAQAITHAPFCPCLIGLPPTRSGSPLTSSIPLPVKLGAV